MPPPCSNNMPHSCIIEFVMALVVNSLASGSSGNSILVREGHTSLLIDVGIGIRTLTSAMLSVGSHPSELSGILITHEHSDHIKSAFRTAARYKVPLIANAPTLERVNGAEYVPSSVLDVGEEMTLGDLRVRSFPISHDAVRPVGYTIMSTKSSVCSTTDTGILTPEIIAEASQADLLILESNHDAEMLRTGPYPGYLKRRVAGDQGHLSNDTAAGLLLDLAESGHPASVWLAHLSKTNNSPAVALTTAQYLLWSCLGTTMDIGVALRDAPSLEWRERERPVQLSLFVADTNT